MAFLNKKERVIDLQLTQYGKYLLSEGRLQPAFYAFYDDDIIYDNYYTNSSASQNQIETNITSSLRVNTQYVFAGVETNFKKTKMSFQEALGIDNAPGFADISFKRVKQNERDRDYGLVNPLGTSQLSSEFYPAWDIRYLHGELTGSSLFTSDHWYPPRREASALSSSIHNIRTPRLRSSIKYTVARKDMNVDPPSERIGREHAVDDELNIGADDDVPALVGETMLFRDDTYIDVKGDYLLLKVQELNTAFEKENFEIEVFEIKEVNENNGQDNREELVPLKFMTDEEDIDLITPEYVEYYFDLLVDREIDQDLIRELQGAPAKKSKLHKNIYKSITGLGPDGVGVEGCD